MSLRCALSLLVLCGPSAEPAVAQSPELRHLGSAKAYLDGVGVAVVESVREVTEAMRLRARTLAERPEVVDGLVALDKEALASLAREAVRSSEILDVVAFFDTKAGLLAINDSDARGNVFQSDRLRALYSTSFVDRNLIAGTLENAARVRGDASDPLGDITRLLSDSSGLSIAFTTPVVVDGTVCGAVSVRVRLERLLARIHATSFFDGGNRIWFVSENGAYFDEAVRSGAVEPPVPSPELRDLLLAIDWEYSASFEYERKHRVVCLFDLPELTTVEGAGIRVLLEASPEWVTDVARASLDREEALESSVLSILAIAGLLTLALVIAWTTRRRLGRAFERADRASRAKTSFLASTSHEIRTPMTAILGYAEVLAGKGDQVASRELAEEAVDAIQRHGQHLLTLIGDVLDFAKIEAGAIVLDPQPMDPRQLTGEVGELLAGKAQERGVALELDVARGVPACVSMDATRMRQILINLVGNAIKFTEEGSVVLRLRALDTVTGKRLVFQVVDTGIGMSHAAAAAIFDPYVQAEASTTRQYGGTGLGLSISRQLAELMGGTIECTSAPGKGSTFTVTVRVPVLDRAALGGSEPASLFVGRVESHDDPPLEPVELEGARVLLVDDSATNRRLFSLILERAGIDVTVAENGRQAVEVWQSTAEPFELILMDAQMPVLDGPRALEELRGHGAQLPIVVLTADAVSGAREGYLASGFDDFVTKPISRQALLDVVSKHVGRHRAQQVPQP